MRTYTCVLTPHRRNWAKGKTKKTDKKTDKDKALADLKEGRPYLLIFVTGSVGYNEMRCAYEVAEAANMDVFIGEAHAHTHTHTLDSHVLTHTHTQARARS
jgi:hypothetical protein